MAKGDTVRVLIDVGEKIETIQFEADQNGRMISVERSSKLIEIELLTRGGTVVERGEFAADRVVAVVSRHARP